MIKKIIKYIFLQIIIFFKRTQFHNEIKKIYIVKKNYNFFNKISDSFSLIFVFRKDAVFSDDFSENIIFYDSEQIPSSNANLLIFENNFFSVKKLPKTKTDYFFISFFDFVINFPSLLKHAFTYGYFLSSFKTINGSFGVIMERKNKARKLQASRFMPYVFTRKEFLVELRKQNISYVVLRLDSFEELNNFEEDIDLLIDFKDINKIEFLLDSYIGVLPIDIYSSNGETLTSYLGLPYYPFSLANDILKDKIIFEGYFIPSKYYQLISYVFHLLFHKSIDSGIAINKDFENKTIPKKDYLKKVKLLFKQNNIALINYNLDSLFTFLKKENKLPQYDLILKFQDIKKDVWYDRLMKNVKDEVEIIHEEIKGITIFLLRENAFSEDICKLINKRASDFGFYIIDEGQISESNTLKVNNAIRAGKWDIGPYQVNAGKPKYYFVLYDPFFISPKGDFLKRYPHLENRKATQLKEYLRKEINTLFSKTMNSIHSSDDYYEAVFYLTQILSSNSSATEIIKKCKKIKEQYVHSENVILDLSRTLTRAKVELINYNGKKAVKKTYKKNKLNYLNNEVWFCSQFSKEEYVPDLLEVKENYLIFEYFENAVALEEETKILTTDQILQIKKIFLMLFKKGITLIDLNPSNILITQNGKIKIIDFEYAQKYKERPKKIDDLYEISKFNFEKVNEYPFGHENIKDAYKSFFLFKIYLTKNQFLKTQNRKKIYTLVRINFFLFNTYSFLRKLIRKNKQIYLNFKLKVISMISSK